MIVWCSLIIYVVLLRIVFYKNFNSKRTQKLFLILAGIGIVFIMGSRYANISLRGDLNNYFRLYYNASHMSLEELLNISTMEYGYIVFNKILSTIIPWNQMIIYAEAIICVYAISRYIYINCKDPFLGILFYICHGFMIFQLTGFRQAIAMSICLLSIEFIKNNNPLKFVITILFAMSFHSTAIIFLPTYIFLKNKVNFKNIIIYFILCGSLAMISPYLLELGSFITGTDYTGEGFNGSLIGPIINITIFLLGLKLSYKFNEKIIEPWKFNMTYIALILYLIRFISLPFERISFYFVPGAIVLLVDGIINIKNKKNREYMYIWISIISIILFLYRVYSTIGINYRFFWEKF